MGTGDIHPLRHRKMGQGLSISQQRGALNFLRLLLFLESEFFELGETVPEALPVPFDGLYHPDIQGVPEIDDYLEKHIAPGRITVGIWFSQIYWLNNDVAYIDAMIRACENSGVNVIPVFHVRYKDASRGNPGAEHVARTFFMKDGKAVIDVLLSPMMFSLTLMDPSCKDLFAELNVPVIQAMVTMQPYESWKEEVQGMSTMEVGLCAAQPEFDGNLIFGPVASREQDKTDPLTGALLARYVPIPERTERCVSLAVNWARLAKKKNAEKKVAIVFHHYPPRNDRIGCAAGLDSFTSVKRLLDRMKRAGYLVDDIYEDGDELAQDRCSPK